MPTVKLYFKAGNPYCEMIRNVLTYHKIPFEMVEVGINKKAQQELKKVSGQEQVPVLVVDSKVYVGYDFELMKKALGLEKKTEESNESF